MQRVGLIVTVCLASLVSLGIAQASAQTQSWPTKPIKVFIPFSAGSATDIIPRAVFDRVAADLGQPIIVENRGGAGGTIAVAGAGGEQAKHRHNEQTPGSGRTAHDHRNETPPRSGPDHLTPAWRNDGHPYCA